MRGGWPIALGASPGRAGHLPGWRWPGCFPKFKSRPSVCSSSPIHLVPQGSFLGSGMMATPPKGSRGLEGACSASWAQCHLC